MKSTITQCLQIACIYIGVVIGAGFASGKEMSAFFLQYGATSLYGAIGAGLLFVAIGSVFSWRCHTAHARNFSEYVRRAFGKKIGTACDALTAAFMLAGFIVMQSGAGALVFQQFGVPSWIGACGMAAACYFVLSRGLSGVMAINTVLAPLMVVGIAAVAIMRGVQAQTSFSWIATAGGIVDIHTLAAAMNIFGAPSSVAGGIATPPPSVASFFGLHTSVAAAPSVGASAVGVIMAILNSMPVSAVLYVCYNMLSAMPVLAAAGAEARSRAVAAAGAALGGIALLLCMIMLWWVLHGAGGAATAQELPLLHIATALSPLVGYLYVFILLAAMFTTAVASGFGVLSFTRGVLGGSRLLDLGVRRELMSQDAGSGGRDRMDNLLPVSRRSGVAPVSCYLNPVSCEALLCILSLPLSGLGFSTLVANLYAFFGYIGIVLVVLLLVGGLRRS